MRELKNIVKLFLAVFIIFFLTGCLPNQKNSQLFNQPNSTKKIYIKNDTNAYDTYKEDKKTLQTLKRGEEYNIKDIKDNYIELSKSINEKEETNFWVSIDDTEIEKTYFLTLLVNASNPSITIAERPYESAMRLASGTYEVNITANNFLDKSFDITINKDTLEEITLEFNMDTINKKIVEEKSIRELKESIYLDKNQELMWQDETAVLQNKKPWLTTENYDARSYNDTSGDTATSYCKRLVLASFKDWRLPTKEELKKLSLEKNFLRFIGPNWYWSDTTSDSNSELAWSIYFDNSDGYTDFKNVSNYVRCVRVNK